MQSTTSTSNSANFTVHVAKRVTKAHNVRTNSAQYLAAQHTSSAINLFAAQVNITQQQLLQMYAIAQQQNLSAQLAKVYVQNNLHAIIKLARTLVQQ